MTITASVSVRESLRWIPNPAFEDADVLVLGFNNHFYIDLRVYVKGPKAGTVDWAAAGVRLQLPGNTIDGTPVRFVNVIDNRKPSSLAFTQLQPPNFLNPEEVSQDLSTPLPDDTLFTPLPPSSAREERVLETGSMHNPDSETPEAYVPYEEVWRDLAVAPGSPVILLETIGGDDKGKAYTGRLANWRMALSDNGKGAFWAWREDFSALNEWKVKYELPVGSRSHVPAVTGDEDWEQGEVVRLEGRDWLVRLKGVTA
ncbi:hypothetical protein T439DRAFT_324470 [Meredithblackwellia eburnea MCA 4105]